MIKNIAVIMMGTLLFGSVALATPKMVPGVKCVACHLPGKFNKTGLNDKSKENQAKFKDKKCGECHENKDGALALKAGVAK